MCVCVRERNDGGSASEHATGGRVSRMRLAPRQTAPPRAIAVIVGQFSGCWFAGFTNPFRICKPCKTDVKQVNSAESCF